MADKILYYAQLANEQALQIIQSYQAWTGFMDTVGRLYKYPYYEQLMIAAQRPDATACASYELWNQRMQRYVKRGSRGIALIDTNGEEPKLKYVFDISDTGTKENSKRPFQWEYREEHKAAVITVLTHTQPVLQATELPELLEELSSVLIDAYWDEHWQDILSIVDGSTLAAYDEENIRSAFREAATISTTYAIMSRCGLDPKSRFEHEDFMPVFDFNTPQSISALGTAISQTSEHVLRQIEVTIKALERQKQAERRQHHDRSDIQTERRLPDSEPAVAAEQWEASGQIWADAETVSAGAQAGPLEQSDPVGNLVSPSAGDRRDSEPSSGPDDGEADATEQRNGNAESQRPNEVGGPREQSESTGRRDNPDRTDLQLSETPIILRGEQLAIFPSEDEQIEQIEGPKSTEVSFGFFASQAEIDHILRLGSNTDYHRMRIATEFMKNKPLPEIASFLRDIYHGGNGITMGTRSISSWYTPSGIRMAAGVAARYTQSAQVLSWESAAERIGQLLETGQFLTNVELEEAPGYERKRIAERLWYLYRDILDRDVAKQLFPSLQMITGSGFPQETAQLQTFLSNQEQTAKLTAEYGQFMELYRMNRSILRFHHREAAQLLTQMQELALPRREYHSDLAELTVIRQFITEDEVNEALAYGSSISGGKGRIYDYFTENHSMTDKAALLKKEYGISGRSHALSGSSGSDMMADGKGIRFRKKGCDDVTFSWSVVAKRISTLIDQDRYLTIEEKSRGIPEEQEPVAEQEKEVPPATKTLTQDDIDTALQEWNGSIESKRAVVRYMHDHSREKETADWLKQEYGDNLPAFPVTADGEASDLSWNKVQKRIAQLIQKDRFYTEEELDRMDDVDPIAIRERIAETEVPETKYITETETFYSAEESNLPFDVVIQTLRTKETEIDSPSPTGSPVSTPIDGAWQEFPDARAAEQAASAEYKATIAGNAQNFQIHDESLGIGGPKAKYQDNISAIKLMKYLEAEGMQALPEQQEVLSRYVGWGGLADAFDPDKENWKKEYAELKELLTPEEYIAARASTLNAHYTSPVVIRAIYEAVGNMGFQTGNILEPAMGVGNFFGCLPEAMQNSKLYGVELDSITGRIAKQLYPKATITVAGFETTDRRDFFDLAIGNVPFGQYQVNDRAYNKLGFSIHDYFFAKALDQVRPGGVVAFVTSRYTMDKQTPDVRKYIAQRAELLGAIRLPNNAFKANAGTDVVSDILFLQKRDRPIEVEPDWVHLGKNEDGFSINSYFIDHPEMILGRQSSESTQYGRQDFTVEPIDGLLLEDQLHDAVKYIRGTYTEAELPDLGEGDEISKTLPADPNVKNYSYTVVDGDVYYRENSVMVQPDLNATAKERIKGLVELRDCVHRLIDLQMWESDPINIRNEQQRLNDLYDTFSAKYGLINDRGNRLAFSDDNSYYLLCSLEVLDEEGRLERKADMFTKRTIKQAQAVTSVDTASEALAVSIAEKACVDMEFMEQLTGKTEQELARDLCGVIFKDFDRTPDDSYTYRTADEFLSGNVRSKLAYYNNLLPHTEGTDKYEDVLANIEALQAAQPKDLEASEIDVRLGATWIDKSYIQKFMEDLLDPPFYLRRAIRVNFSPYTAEWNITGKSQIGYQDVNANVTYGTNRVNAYKLLEETLNLRDIRVYDTVIDADGKEKRVLNPKATTLASQKQDAIKAAFRDWIWKDPHRRETLVAKYNELFNATRPREYNGVHITFSGMTPEISLREHQKSAIAHVLYGGNTLLAHEVGAGKTFEMVAAAMESKRLGLCRKSLFAVPNHLTEQWASEFLRLYPSANILVATRKDFETRNRKKFCGRIATGDYDAIIMGHSQFEKIPVSIERQERLLHEQLDEIEAGIEELKSSGAEKFTIKSMEKTRKSLEVKLQKLQSGEKKDDVVMFEQLGVDRLFVDEAHSYKNLFLYTKMRNVAGLSTSDAQKSSDMLMKCRYMDEITGGKGIVFATGTPVSNSMTELYTMMRYLQHEMLKDHNWTHFDCWASQFGETKTAIELAPEGTGYRARTRFAKFYNLPELITLWKESADVKTADQLNLPRPKAIFHNEVANPTPHQKALVEELSERASKVHSGAVDPSTDNMLKITSDGRKLGLDQRLINPALPDDPASKINLCVDNIVRIWEEGAAEKLTQLVFCDISTPKSKTQSEQKPESFTVYDDIRTKLVARGIPAEQVAFIHDANTEVRKKELFAKVRSGQVRVLMGSTFKMGAGMNVQDRLIALHDLDCPWRPGDLEQRAGRIIRQGNRNPEVHIYRYVTEGTFDSYLWQTVENKQKFISQIMTSKSPVRSCEDVDETALSYAEIKALCAGDPRIKEKMDLDIDVSRLRLLKADHQSQQFRLEDNLLKHFPEQVEQNKNYIAGFEADMKTLGEHPHPEDGFAGMVVRGDAMTDKDNAGAAILEACKEVTGLVPVEIGTYRGFTMLLSLENFGRDYILTMKGQMSHRATLGSDARGNLTRIDNALSQMEDRKRAAEAQLQDVCAQIEHANAELGKPFPQEEELRVKSARLAELNAVLNIDEKSPAAQLAEDASETRIAKSAKPSVLQKLNNLKDHNVLFDTKKSCTKEER